MALNIRPYADADKAALLALGRAMHAEAPLYRDIPFDDARATRTIENVSANGAVFVADEDGALVGMVGGVVSEHFFTAYKIAFAICHYVAPAKRGSSAAARLVKVFENWAFTFAGADETILSPSTGVSTDAVVTLYERLGYTLTGHSLRKKKPDLSGEI